MVVLEELIGQILDEKYRIEKQLGQGGMGAVFLATHLGTKRPVAIKVISPQFMADPEFVQRFRREAEAAGRLRHPNVVNVTDFGFARVGSEQLAYLVMEYLDGCTLGNTLNKEGRLPLGFVVDIVEQVCLAINEAHKQGIIHRDLKPDNIWLEPNGRGGYNVKVLDFGLAKLRGVAPPILADNTSRTSISSADLLVSSEGEPAISILHPVLVPDAVNLSAPTQAMPDKSADEVKPHAIEQGLTRAGAVLGTPLYMSPEQCCSEKLDARSDIYSLGVIVYQMLTGETPFIGRTHELIAQHIETPPTSLKEKRREIPKPVADLVMSALAKSPAERPATAAAFATALRANVESAGMLVRRALAVYGEHFPALIRIFIIPFLPILAFSLLRLVNLALVELKIMSVLLGGIAGFFWLFYINGLVVWPISFGVLIPVVVRLLAAPLHSVEIRPAFAVFKKRLFPLMTATALFSIYFITIALLLNYVFAISSHKLIASLSKNADITFAFDFLATVGAAIWTAKYCLYNPVVMIEGKGGRAALARSKSLVIRSRSTAILLSIFFTAIPYFLAVLIRLSIGHIIKEPNPADINFGFSTIPGIVVTIFSTLLTLAIYLASGIAFALLYFKTRQAGGETLKEVLDQFETETLSHSA